MNCEVVDQNDGVDEEPDVVFSANLDGTPYEVLAWSTQDGLSICINPFGTFEKLVNTVKPELSAKETEIVSSMEF